MLIKSPLRISLGGGGTDLPAYYTRYGGAWISAAINKYAFIEKADFFKTGASFPTGTGMGSSSAFFVCLAKIFRTDLDGAELAETAFQMESKVSPVGKQDHYISSLGGVVFFRINQAGEVSYEYARFDYEKFLSKLSLWFLGSRRSANVILKDQQERIDTTANYLHKIRGLGIDIYDSLIAGDFDSVGLIFDEHWKEKKKISSSMTSKDIDGYYSEALNQGALGGKVIGAGGGGFVMFYSNKPLFLPLDKVEFKFDFEGCVTSGNI